MKVLTLKIVKNKFLLAALLLLFAIGLEISIIFTNHPSVNAEDSSLTINRCHDLTSSAQISCWEDLMNQTLADKGLGSAFDLMDALFKTEPKFAPQCHSFAHLLGQKAYQFYSEKKDFDLSPKSSYCGYGFYHGFMEELVQKTNDMNEARSFCEYVDKKLSPFIADAGGACYHGIGHGTVDGTDLSAWGKPEAMIQPALSLCEKVSNDEVPPPQHGKLFRCVTGAFNALEILEDSNQFKLTPDKTDPFSICRTQPDKYKEACYTQFVVAAMQSTGGSFEKTAELIDTIPEDRYAIPTMQAMVVEKTNDANVDYSQIINFCHNLPSRFNMPCITSLGEGFLKYGPPQSEYVRAIDFCSSSLLTEDEKLNCFDRVLSILRNFYTAQKSAQICQMVDPKYRQSSCIYQ
jgi:hypothetical protein